MTTLGYYISHNLVLVLFKLHIYMQYIIIFHLYTFNTRFADIYFGDVTGSLLKRLLLTLIH